MQKLKFGRFSSTFITNTILVVLFIVFILETIMGGSTNINTLLRLGAMNNQLVTVEHQWWRLFTAQFLHIGWLHIASNAVMIYYVGQFMEPLLGHWWFLSVYLLSGIGGNLLSYAYGSGSVVSAGASTALFGLLGVVIALYLANRAIPAINYLGKHLHISHKIPLTGISLPRPVHRVWRIGIGLYRLSRGSQTNSPFRPFPQFVPR